MNRRTMMGAVAAAALLLTGGVGQAAQKVLKFGVAAEPYPPFTSQNAQG